MEEIVTVDGRQFKLSVDRPLNATERTQVLTEIRKQTGCGTCGTPRILGGMQDLAGSPTATTGGSTYTAGNKQSGDDVTLSVQPTGGVGTYSAYFYIHHNSADRGTMITTTRLGTSATGATHARSLAGSPATNPITGIAEGVTTTRSYVLDDYDISTANLDAVATEPTNVDTTDGTLTFGAVTAAKAAAAIRFYTAIVDSCTGTAGPAACIQWSDVTLMCVAPTCNFVVS